MWEGCLLSNAILKKYGKWPKNQVLIQHSYWNPQFWNFAIPPKWLSHTKTLKYCYPQGRRVKNVNWREGGVWDLNEKGILHQSSFHHFYWKIMEKSKFDAKRISNILWFALMPTTYFFQLKTKKKLDKSSTCGLPL